MPPSYFSNAPYPPPMGRPRPGRGLRHSKGDTDIWKGIQQSVETQRDAYEVSTPCQGCVTADTPCIWWRNQPSGSCASCVGRRGAKCTFSNGKKAIAVPPRLLIVFEGKRYSAAGMRPTWDEETKTLSRTDRLELPDGCSYPVDCFGDKCTDVLAWVEPTAAELKIKWEKAIEREKKAAEREREEKEKAAERERINEQNARPTPPQSPDVSRATQAHLKRISVDLSKFAKEVQRMVEINNEENEAGPSRKRPRTATENSQR